MQNRTKCICGAVFTIVSTLFLLLSFAAQAAGPPEKAVKEKSGQSVKPQAAPPKKATPVKPTNAKSATAKPSHPKPAITKPAAPKSAPDNFTSVKQRLIEEGFPPTRVQSIYSPNPELMLKTVAATFHIRESKLNYDQFLEAPSIAKARAFMESHTSILNQAESRYGVSRCVIAAILLVETQFGSYTGKTPTLAILSTFAVMDNESYRDRVWVMLPPEDKDRWDRDAFDRKLQDRSRWAYQELFALMRLAESQPARVGTYRGSVMGAVGWPQFLPSSLVQYGVDGNQDGRTDLFQPADAILSTANYLKGYGWCQARTQAEKEDVIHHYNRSRPYVNAVLGVADRLCESP